MVKSKTKRLRVFAGPNGSGKTTLAKNLNKEGKFHLKIFVNADEIETELKERKYVLLNDFQLNSNTRSLRSYISKFGMSPIKLSNPDIVKYFKISKNSVYFSGSINSYIAADLASFIRESLLIAGKSFAFETVFSHESKLEFMQRAKTKGYNVYFYFLATDDPEININRVKIRVDKQGHGVNPEKITQRYYRSLNLLYDAVKVSFRSYLFDNSGKYFELVAEVNYGKTVSVLDIDKSLPNWFIKYFYNKANS